MLPKTGRKDYILDRLHRGFVNTCLFVTAVTGVMIGYKVYEFYWYVRPLRKEMELKAERELLAEGKPLEE